MIVDNRVMIVTVRVKMIVTVGANDDRDSGT